MAERRRILSAVAWVFLIIQLVSGTDTLQSRREGEGVPEGFGHESDDDIILTPEQMEIIMSRKAHDFSGFYWTEVGGFPQVPFTFADNLVDQAAVKLAIQHWEDHTCLVFPEVSTNHSTQHIIFQRHQFACNSYVGMVFPTGQPINVPVWCEESFGSLVHEIGHAIGFFHEQSRSDRDEFVRINTANIIPGAISNFDKMTDNNFSVPYDYNSDMHYYERAFDANGRITIATINPLYQGTIGQRDGLSHMDKLLANRMYSCIEKNLVSCSLVSDPCQNHGYLGKNCICLCPPGTSGTNCEIYNYSHNDEKLSDYNEVITTETQVTSANHPFTTPGGEKYTKVIEAPACKLVKLTFSEFFAIENATFDGVTACYYEGLEIRTDDLYDGEWFCGTDITAGQEFISTGNKMILFFKANGGWSPAKWSATINFVNDPSCPAVAISTTTPPSTTTTTSTTTTPPTSSTSTASTTTTTVPTSSTSTVSITATTASSTSTSTSTTSTTDSSTSSTSSTSSSTTTTEIAPITTTTTPEPIPECRNRGLPNGAKRFYSINYPNNYPNNAECRYENNEDRPKYALLRFSKFRLHRGDSLTIEHPYGNPFVFRGLRRRPFVWKLPAQFRATFASDALLTNKGFSIDVSEKGSRCHQTVDATTRGLVTTQNFPRNHQSNYICEWRIRAPPGKRVLVHLFLKKVSKGNFVAVNTSPEDTKIYDPAVVKQFRGSSRRFNVLSVSNTISVFYWGKQPDRGFRLIYRQR